MKITKIVIDNYKSIKHLEIIPSPGLNAFIGENSVGKSNIFNAINWILGPVYPSFNSTTNQDHWEGNNENKICIQLEYLDGTVLELNECKEVNNRGNTEFKAGLFANNQTWTCKGELRENCCSAYLGIEREIQDYLPSNKWSLIGRILLQINQQFENESMNVVDEQGNKTEKKKSDVLKEKLHHIRDDILFSVGRKDKNQKDGLMDQFVKILQEESAKQLNRDESNFTIDLSLYDPWNFYKTLQLIVKENDMGMEFQASSLGMGVQASITIAILKAYAELNLPNKTPIFIDEPELFLHPQAQRNFYNILREMSADKLDASGKVIGEGLQIFYTTHSPNFLRTDRFNEVFIVRKNKERGTYINIAKVDDFVIDFNLRYKNKMETSQEDIFLYFNHAFENTGDSQKANEAFFAKKIILVEGQSESLLLPYFFDLAEFDYIKEGISIVRCGSKDEIDRFFKLYNEFGIPCYIIFDGDKQNQGTEAEGDTIKKNKALLTLFGINHLDWPDGNVQERFLGFEKRLEENLEFYIPEDVKSLKLFILVKNNINLKMQLPSWVSKLIEKIKLLNTPLSSVLKTNETNDTLNNEVSF